MRKVEADHSGAVEGALNAGVGNNVGREFGTLEVLDVLVRLVDDLRQRLAVDHLLVHVHFDLIVKHVVLHGIAAEDAHERRTEVAPAQMEDTRASKQAQTHHVSDGK